jgi:hypothetical protein
MTPLRFPVRALSRVFRGQFLDALTQAYTNGAFIFPGTTAALGTSQGFATLTEQLRKKDWVVDTQKPFAGPAQVLDYVSRSPTGSPSPTTASSR